MNIPINGVQGKKDFCFNNLLTELIIYLLYKFGYSYDFVMSFTLYI